MAIDNKLFRKAREKFWEDYHEKIDRLGFQLSRNGMMMSDNEISILAIISPYYSNRTLKKIKKIIPTEYSYDGEKIKVYIFPSMSDLASKFEV